MFHYELAAHSSLSHRPGVRRAGERGDQRVEGRPRPHIGVVIEPAVQDDQSLDWSRAAELPLESRPLGQAVLEVR
ncbi:hypothetical protein JK358_05370 [Nocardia sp. 2]|uniref:Uncharacterized protein n=1 Tax=Nocardia acididurans TaxID=2802282 RepID=A0ABS1LZZ7_9NOCA|nr:hypothetical protein [Nocardia acididurans]MBL1073816.1 hypothetical protein [Nocardia acididurans]